MLFSRRFIVYLSRFWLIVPSGMDFYVWCGLPFPPRHPPTLTLHHGRMVFYPCTAAVPSWALGNHIREPRFPNSVLLAQEYFRDEWWMPWASPPPEEGGGSELLLFEEILWLLCWITWFISVLFWLLPIDTITWLTKLSRSQRLT